MDTGKVKVVLNALREELQARRTTSAEGTESDDAPLPGHGNAGADADRDHAGERDHARRAVPRDANGVLVDLSNEARAGATVAERFEDCIPEPEFSQRPIPELVVPFFVPQEPFIIVAPYLVRAVLAAAAAGILMLFLL